MRLALAAYEASRPADREFSLAGVWSGDGTSVAEVPEEELLSGFGR